MAKQHDGEGGDPLELSLPRSTGEKLALVSGQLAMFALEHEVKAGRKRFSAFHSLRVAARKDPIAAYNLGNYLSNSADASRRPRREAMALGLFERAALGGLERIRNAQEPFSKAPGAERFLRDIISRALTNVGGSVANSGWPIGAVDYFKRSITLYPDNPNSHVCLGNMGVFHSKETGIDIFDGIKSWETAAKIGDYCHESTDGCSCRAGFISSVRRIESQWGKEAARTWVARANWRMANGTRMDELQFPWKHLADVRGSKVRLSENSIEISDYLGKALSKFVGTNLELKVTTAATILLYLARLDRPEGENNPAVLNAAMTALAGIVPLAPFLGDDEWRYVGRPDTDYLLTDEIALPIQRSLEVLLSPLKTFFPGLKAQEAVVGFLFHLEPGFRRGVSSMVEKAVKMSRTAMTYAPALQVGSPPHSLS